MITKQQEHVDFMWKTFIEKKLWMEKKKFTNIEKQQLQEIYDYALFLKVK